MSTALDFSKKTLVLITGASRGIGLEIATQICPKLGSGSRMIVSARNASSISNQNFFGSLNRVVDVQFFFADFSQPESYDEEIKNLISTENAFETAIIFHNAGQVGVLKNASQLTDLELWRRYYDTNFFSMIMVNNSFLKYAAESTKKIYVVNISSLCGHKPFTNLAMYGSAKAARDLFFSVLDIEEPNVMVLKYCPGPVKTDMVNEIIEMVQSDDLRKQFKDMKETGTILTAEQTVKKLLNILATGKFKSGDLIDYFDDE